MRLLSVPFEAERVVAPVSWLRPVLAVAAAMLALVGTGRWLELAGEPFVAIGRPLQGAAVHGGFVALGWVIALEGRRGWHRPALRVAGVLFLAFGLARLQPWGSLAYLLPPLVLLREARRHPALCRIGVGPPARPHALGVGLAAGAFLGSHLLVSASRTLGYAASLPDPRAYAAALGYDVGANVLSAEWLFRGAIFSLWWRRWGFWTAALTSTALSLPRYLLDPWLPRAVEVGTGAVFYLMGLGLCASALRAWSGSLLPGYLASLGFFAAYRMLVGW
jgi:hypothetical protein